VDGAYKCSYEIWEISDGSYKLINVDSNNENTIYHNEAVTIFNTFRLGKGQPEHIKPIEIEFDNLVKFYNEKTKKANGTYNTFI
jgi:hypothetical protein